MILIQKLRRLWNKEKKFCSKTLHRTKNIRSSEDICLMVTKVPTKKLQILSENLKAKISTLPLSSENINMYSTYVNTINLKLVPKDQTLGLIYLISVSYYRYQ